MIILGDLIVNCFLLDPLIEDVNYHQIDRALGLERGHGLTLHFQTGSKHSPKVVEVDQLEEEWYRGDEVQEHPLWL